MAQRIVTTMLDDTDETGQTAADETVTFSLDGQAYEIDLSEANASELRADLARWITHARRVGRTGRLTGPRSTRTTHVGPSPATVRAWATANGFEVPARGRIPSVAAEAYRQANPAG